MRPRRKISIAVGGVTLAGLIGWLGWFAVQDSKLPTNTPAEGTAEAPKSPGGLPLWPALPVAEEAQPPAAPPEGSAQPAAVDYEELAADELQRLAAAVKLSDQQRPRAAKIVNGITHVRALIGRHPPGEHRLAREAQLAKQERLALLSVITREQEPLLDAYLAQR